jgi:hypothetical protein
MVERRTFLCWLLSGAAALPLRGVRLHAQAATLSEDSLVMLRALAPVVLPSDLRSAGHDKVVNDFVQWLASYRGGAERSWGYGSPRKTGTAAIDTARYAMQLRDLDDRARQRGDAFEVLAPDARREVVLAALEQSGVRELPSAPGGQHVVADLMSFFFTSGPAYDLAYGASIRRGTCRGLAGSAARPTPSALGD